MIDFQNQENTQMKTLDIFFHINYLLPHFDIKYLQFITKNLRWLCILVSVFSHFKFSNIFFPKLTYTIFQNSKHISNRLDYQLDHFQCLHCTCQVHEEDLQYTLEIVLWKLSYNNKLEVHWDSHKRAIKVVNAASFTELFDTVDSQNSKGSRNLWVSSILLNQLYIMVKVRMNVAPLSIN